MELPINAMDPAVDPDRRWRHLLGKLRFRHLQLLANVHARGSLHAAAEAMHLTQPSLSKALAEVEAAFGFPLFERGPRGLTATADGRLVLDSATLLLAELAHLHRSTLEQPASAVLRLGMPPFVAQAHVPAVVAQLSAVAPLLRLQLREGRVPALVQALLDGQLDALITSYAAEISQAGAGLCFEKLHDSTVAVIAPPGHPLARRARLAWAGLLKERWILPDRGTTLRRWVDEVFAQSGQLAPAPWIESSNPITNLRLVAAGQGLSAVPAELLSQPGFAGQVAQLALPARLGRGPVSLVYRTGAVNPRVALLRQALGLAAREPGPGR